MCRSELGRKSAIDAPSRLALASDFVMRLPGGRGRLGGTSLSSRRRNGPGRRLWTGGIAPSPGRDFRNFRAGQATTGGGRVARDGATRMRIERRDTKAGEAAHSGIAFRAAVSEIRNPDGSIVFRQEGIEVPAAWSQVATDVLAQKYFRKAGVPARLKKVEENSVPSFLWRSVADEKALAALPEAERTVSEHSSKQVFDRLAGCWTYWGWKGGYFSAEEDAQAFFDEIRAMLALQMCAPNSPQWFNTGLHWAYGIDGPSQGHYYVDFQTGKLTKSK